MCFEPVSELEYGLHHLARFRIADRLVDFIESIKPHDFFQRETPPAIEVDQLRNEVLGHGPTFHDDTIYAESEILEVTPSTSKADRGVVYLETRAVNQKGEKVMSFRRRVLIPRRPV